MKALIKVGYGCNDHCSFCHTLDVRHIDAEAAEVRDKIKRAKALGHTMVVLSGGEPTIRPELMAWAQQVADLDMDFGLVTNGRVLSYPDVVTKLLASRLRYVYLSLHGGSARVHNRLVRSEAFDQTYGALDQLSGHGLDLTANCVVTKHNVDHLRELVDAMVPYPDATLKFSMVEPKGGGKLLFDALIPRVSDAAAKVRDAMAYADELANGPAVRHGGFPLCLMAGYEQRYADLKSDQFWTMIEVGEPDYFPVDDKNKLQPAEPCRGCSLSGPCPGLYRVYHDVYGADELTPKRRGPRSNSFNYTFEARVRPSPDGSCPVLRIGVSPWDYGRHLFVANGDRVARFFADTRDFSDDQIAAIKHERGQVYVDVATDKAAPDDFATDLMQLQRSGLCDGCPQRSGCTGLFEPVKQAVFERDDDVIRGWLGELHGDVLDIGFGERRYDDVLSPLVQAGRINYVGIDPDENAVARTRETLPWAHVSQASLAQVAGDHRYDALLVLRSWNHLDDGPSAMRQLLGLAKPGATLIIVDNEAFGLARTRRQTERAHAGAPGFEHFRNDSADDVHALTAELDIELLDRHVVGPQTSNQWALRYRVGSGNNPL